MDTTRSHLSAASVAACALLLASPGGVLGAAERAGDETVLTGELVYPSPDSPPIRKGAVVIRGGKIVAVHESGEAPAADEGASACDGGFVTAGFHNGHVHFTGAEFANARTQSAATLEAALATMLTRYGFTTVVDTSSDLDNTVALRERIEKGELRGPRILTAGIALYPPNGVPIYLADLPPELTARLPQPASAEQAVAHVRANAAGGAEATKLFLITPQAGGATRQMPAAIAKAATAEAHRRGQLVLAHPTNLEGMRLAIDAGVDALVHTTLGAREPWPDADLKRAINAHIAIAPTLMLLPYELAKQRVPEEVAAMLLASTVKQFGAFAAGGGYVIFGTDVGYMTRFDPTEEYVLMAEAGLTPMQILASLTSAQARLWKEDERRGRLAEGYDADIVVLDADPTEDVRNFAKVRCALRGGEVIYSRAEAR